MAGIVWGTIGGAIQTGFGISQYYKGKRLAEEIERPTYEIPPEIQQNLSMAQMRALEGLPAEQKQAYVENIQRSMQSGMAGLQDRGLGVAGVSSMMQNQQDAYRQLMGADAMARLQGETNLATARSTMARFRDRKFDVNQMQPYMTDWMESRRLMGQGAQDTFAGMQQMGAAESEGADRFENYMGSMGGGMMGG